MHPEQKQSWFIVTVAAIAVLGIAALAPFVGARAWGALGLFGLAGLAPLLFRSRADSDDVVTDERDEMITRTAATAGFAISYVWFVLGAMVIWFLYRLRGHQALSVDVLPFIVVVGAFVFFVTRAVLILVLYGKHTADARDSD